ncbi:MAG TPA: hypothetical protein VMH78_02680 [Thermoplasmata archaeon]|nr:hypothetical protein [Thermoplasmata archaeon]
MSLAGVVGIAVAVALVAFPVAYYAWVYSRNRRLGTPGIVSRARLTCPKCGRTFDLDFVPGAAFSAIRLGRSRYMACPLCHRWSVFPIWGHQIPAGPPSSP